MLATQHPSSVTESRLLGAPSGELRFRVQGGEHHGRILRIAASKCSIGSAPGCTLRLRGENIEPLHCLILTGKNGTIVRRNSPRTYINGGPFEDATLHIGDILRIGPVELAVVACPQGVCSSRPQTPELLDASHFEQAADIEQRIADEVGRAREEERLEQERLAQELDRMKEQLRTVQEQLESSQRIYQQAALKNQQATDQIRDQHTQVMDRMLQQQREEWSEGLARERQFQSEICRAQQSAEELTTRLAAQQALAEQQTADDRQTILQLQEELRTQQNQLQQERGDFTTTQQELENARALLQAEVESLRGELKSRQPADELAAEKVRELESQLAEARQLGHQEQERGLAEKQRLQEEFSTVRNRLESCVASLTDQLRKQEAEVAEAQERSGECGGARTLAFDEVRDELREMQLLRSHENVERASGRGQLEEQLANLTARLGEKERELARCESELAELRQRSAQLDASEQEMQQLREKLALASAAQQLEQETWLTERNELQRKQLELAAGLSDAECMHKAIEEHCQSLETSRNELQTQCQGLESRCVSLQTSLELTVSQLEESRVTAATAQQSEREMWQAERSLFESQRIDWESSRNNAHSQFLELQTQHTDLQLRFTSLETQYNTLQSQFVSLECKCSELEIEVSQGQQSTRRAEELEREAADLRGRLEEVVALRMTEQTAKVEAIHQYEVQIEQWQSEAHKWQLQAEETAGQLGPMKQRCSILEAQMVELQGTISASFVSESEEQKSELLRAQLEDQKRDLAEARAQLQEEQSQLAKLLAEASAREESLARYEVELREREAACRDQATALEERSQRIATQISQFEAEQAAFARQQATIIQQMSSLEDRVQQLSSAGESRSSHTSLVSPEGDTPALLSDMLSAKQSNSRDLPTEANENSLWKNAERLDPRPEALAADTAPTQNEIEHLSDESDLVVEQLMLAVQSKGDGGESFDNTNSEVNKPAQAKARYTPLSLLDQAAELVKQEDLAGATVQPVNRQPPPKPQFATQTNGNPSPASSEDDDESIEQYMNRLLSRVRGGGNSPASSSSSTPAPQPAQMPACAPVVISEEVAEPKEYVPRTLAPEPPERLSLMRELANTAANSAIHAHARKNQKREIKDRSLLALISLAGATSLFIASQFTGSKLAFVGSMGFVTACCFMGLRALVGSLRQVRQQPQAEEAENQGEVGNCPHDNAPTSEQK